MCEDVQNIPSGKGFYYPVSCHEDEQDLCDLEMRSLFGVEPHRGYVISDKNVDPSRSPFVRGKLTVQLTADDAAGIAAQVGEAVALEGRTFKVIFVGGDVPVDFDQQRAIEKEIGWRMIGKAEMRQPDRLFGVAIAGGRYLFGEFAKSEALWLKHNEKPQPYSTALSTRVARAVVNIAAPHITADLRVIDPCCGIGTVIIEALSMGIDIVGYDLNPLALKGARVNLAHFGMPDVAHRADMTQLQLETADGDDIPPYDAAIIDLPYNLCSKLPSEERLAMLQSARRLAARVVIVTTEPIDDDIAAARLVVTDRCVVRKGKFERQVIVCRIMEKSTHSRLKSGKWSILRGNEWISPTWPAGSDHLGFL
ncbi:tRNA G10 N-methylase Trm11 [Paenibacillus taihuensis]|uniref:tRNA G10 N-methylase Trm11 n=1 Tax=Paenibacillus taihuensis TaxID=1156355 RepID=A0A3D9RJ18_9BACL|nr:RsmD family RNA methyltransferase [Paenibacillus taihuensis]REE78777.1 tRNA G10 N-methylase Trm11 [Paenibacillus taihuensis]